MGWLARGLDWLRSDEAPGPTDPQASAGYGDADAYDGRLVPAGTTVGQILDYVGGSSETWPLDFYSFGVGVSRNAAVTYAALYRTVTLVAGVVAQLISGGHLSVVDQDGKRRQGRRVDRVLEVLTWSPDNGDTPASTMIEDAICDYLLDGNALLVPSFDSQGYVTGLRRMLPWDSDIIDGRNGKAYRLTPVGKAGQEYVASMDVLHVRWGHVLRYGRSRSTREGFAVAPITALRPNLAIGLSSDRYIQRWFQRGAQGKLHFDQQVPDGTQRPTPEQLEQIRDWVHRSVASQKPIVTAGVTSSTLSDTPQDSEAAELRVHQAQELAAAYGVPPPLVGMMVTEWGQGIAELARLFYRFGAKQHTERFLAPFQTRLLARGDRFHLDLTDLLRGNPDEMSRLLMAVQGDSQREPIATRTELRRMAGLTTDPIGRFVKPKTPEAPPAEPPADDAPEMGRLTRTNGVASN